MKRLPLKDFISHSINDIMDGIIDAQKHAKEIHGIVNPGFVFWTSGGVPQLSGDKSEGKKNLTTLDFDIAVTVGEDDKEQGGFGIFAAAFGVGVKGETSDRAETVSRIKFQIITVLPPQKE